VAALGRALQRRRRSWLPERIEILRIERAERGFDRRAEAGYAVAQTATKECNPDSGADTKFWASDSRGAAGMQFVIKFGALAGGDSIEILRFHNTSGTWETSISDLATDAERWLGEILRLPSMAPTVHDPR